MTNIVENLRAVARLNAEARLIAGFDPAGGDLNARPLHHIEWKAADEIERLRSEIIRLRGVIYVAVRDLGQEGNTAITIGLNEALYPEEDPDGHD